jgi:guanosine-3',5'-bis(diphosphate) 3'-pyrophosphohydrolase
MPSSWSDQAYNEAIAFAAQAHVDANQTVPGTQLPYVVHVANVAMQVTAALAVTEGLDGTLAVRCALLHDTVEDTSVTYEQLRARFGSQTADGVLALTKLDAVEKSERMADSLRRIQAQPKAVWMVKIADRITNLQRPPKDWDVAKMARYQREAGTILDALGSGNQFLAGRLEERIDEYTQYIESAR